ncbi:hypothetical protein [Paraflavitalea speifideaquila]|uniref:hypothetical protein n=1 Tax=Paraflavitalea speifideaquila TaxID=3076558 RepID=UPI0028E5BF1A|nr:hypothetical protein [Paraflavitalea speifideiaquila]
MAVPAYAPPQYAYPGSDNYEDDGGDFVKAVKALVTAVASIKELVYGFEKGPSTKDSPIM